MNTNSHARVAAGQLGVLDAELAALTKMTVSELVVKYQELYGERTRSRNRNFLRKRLAWRLQELREGGLPPKALELISELGDEVPMRWRQLAAESTTGREEPRDPRLPPVGSTLSREFKGVVYQVTIRQNGVEFEGELYRSLSAAAKRITGTAWNGFTFFGVASVPKDRP